VTDAFDKRAFDTVTFLGFDVFGTVVDWRTSVARMAEPFLARYAIDVDPLQFADDWRGLYQPSMEAIRSGQREFVTLDVLNRENLAAVLDRHGADLDRIPSEQLDELNNAWERLDPWPDSVEGLIRLKRRFAIGALSNGHIAGMLNLARHAGLPWDVIGGAELSRSYKPQAVTYQRNIAAVGRLPHETAMVAAHNGDLVAARENGMRTVFVCRPAEHGPGQTQDLTPIQDWDLVVGSLTEAADALGC
jgi:2-haloacid dehalogenase